MSVMNARGTYVPIVLNIFFFLKTQRNFSEMKKFVANHIFSQHKLNKDSIARYEISHFSSFICSKSIVQSISDIISVTANNRNAENLDNICYLLYQLFKTNFKQIDSSGLDAATVVIAEAFITIALLCKPIIFDGNILHITG